MQNGEEGLTIQDQVDLQIKTKDVTCEFENCRGIKWMQRERAFRVAWL